MKKKDSNPEIEQEVYIFQTPEQDRSSIATPSELIQKAKPPSMRHSKFRQSTKDSFRKKENLSCYDPHLLKENMFMKQRVDGQGRIYDEFEPNPAVIDVCKTPAELAELNKICEEIFIAEDLDFDIDIPPETEEKQSVAPPKENIFRQEEHKTSADSDLETEIDTTIKSEQPPKDNILCERPPQNLTNRQHAPLQKQKKQTAPSDISEPKISGLTIYRNPTGTTVEITNKLSLLINPIPPGIILTCKLKRSRDLMNLLTPEYDFFLENGLKHIVSAQKKILSNSEAFLISPQISNYDRAKIIATLRTNVLHNEFLILGKEQGKDVKFKFVYGAIHYGKLNKDKTQRSMSVSVPINVSVGVRTDHIRSFSFDSLSKGQQLVLHRKQTAEEKSEKNFLLIDEEEEDDYNYLRLVKESDNIFNIEVQHPLSPLQAFGVALTRFDAQLK